MLLEISGEITPERMKGWCHSQIVGASGRTWTQETSVETAKTDQQRTKGSDLEQRQ